MLKRNMKISARNKSCGLSLIELMVSITISLVLLAGVVSVVVSSSSTHNELTKMSRQLENGRFASQLMKEELQHAGYYGRLYIFDDPPLTLPNPCTTSMTSASPNLAEAIPLPVQGYDDPATSPISCLSNSEHLDGTDILVIRRASTSITAMGSMAANTAYIQSNPDTSIISTTSSDFTLTDKDANASDIRRYRVDIYYISNDTVPTLKRISLAPSGGGLTMITEPLIDGIVDMQVEYAFDNDDDGIVDKITIGGNDIFYRTAPAVSDTASWKNIIGVRLHLLARNIDQSTGYTDDKTYSLGRNSSGNNKTYAPDNNFKHHIFTTTTRMNNVAGRKEDPTWY